MHDSYSVIVYNKCRDYGKEYFFTENTKIGDFSFQSKLLWVIGYEAAALVLRRESCVVSSALCAKNQILFHGHCEYCDSSMWQSHVVLPTRI